MERLVVFEPEESGQRSALHIALHRQGLSHIHRLVGEAALIAWCLQSCGGGGKDQEEESAIKTVSVYQHCINSRSVNVQDVLL